MSVEAVKLPESNKNRANIEKRIRRVLDAHGPDVCGFAVVVWGSDTRSTADLGAQVALGTAHIPEILIPDFARNRLLAVKIEEWVVDEIKGHAPPPDDPA